MSVNKENNPILDVLALRESVNRGTNDALKSIVEQQIKEEMKRIIKEDDSDYEEEEVDTETTNTETPEVENEEGDDVGDESNEDIITDEEYPEDDLEDDEESSEEDLEDDDYDDEEELDGMEDYEVDRETYDVTADDESAIKVFKNMTNSDNIVITKDGDDTIELSDEETGGDYIIDLNGGGGEEDETLGESTNFEQSKGVKKPAVRKPSEEEMKKKSNLTRPVVGVDGRGHLGKIGDGEPFNEGRINEEDEMEETLDEAGVSRSQRTLRNGGKKSEPQIKYSVEQGRVPKVRDGEQLKTESEKRLQRMIEENAVLKITVTKLREHAQNFYVAAKETYATNQKLGKIIKLISEHSTTLDEKKNILDKFDGYKSEEEITSLYESINKELKTRKPVIENIDRTFNDIIPEIKLTQPAVVNEDVKKILDLMNRVCK
jgi:hypothetical protein